MRLFRRTNSIRQAFDADQSAADEHRVSSAAPTTFGDDFDDAHVDLDVIEHRLAEIRKRQQLLLEPAKPERTGSLEQLDLRTLIELSDDTDDNDEDFERRFFEFAAVDSDDRDRSRRWMEKL